ncbi:MAG TPA: hypothetical protein VGJ00_03630 [Rhabdochlamydiaceae bacterium]|jgi:hypothetical protein
MTSPTAIPTNITSSQRGDLSSSVRDHKANFAKQWKGRFLNNSCCDLSQARIKTIVARIIGVLAFVSAITVLSVQVAAAIYIAPACVLFAIACFGIAQSVETREEDQALNALRQDIAHLSLNDLVRRHGWKDFFTLGVLNPDEFVSAYRKQMENLSLLEIIKYYEKTKQQLEGCSKPKYLYFIPHPREFKNKWRTETQNKTFEEILSAYSLEQLQKYDLLRKDELPILKELERTYCQAMTERDARISELDKRFPELIANQSALQEAYANIDRRYNETGWVIESFTIEADYHRAVSEIHNRSMSQKLQAFAACSQFLQERNCTDPHKLKKADKPAYKILLQSYKLEEARIIRQEQPELLRVENQFRTRQQMVTQQVLYAQQQREMDRARAQQRYGYYNFPRKQERDACLQPVNATFARIVSDLNKQYKNRRRIFELISQ